MHDNPNYAAQAILAIRDHSELEMRQKLARKKFSIDEINQTVINLKKANLLDDMQFALLYTTSTLNRKPVGPRFIEFKLKQKGINENIISQVISDTYADNREAELAQFAAEKWRRLHPKYATDKARLSRHLQSRGFSPSVIFALSPESEDESQTNY